MQDEKKNILFLSKSAFSFVNSSFYKGRVRFFSLEGRAARVVSRETARKKDMILWRSPPDSTSR